MVQVVCQLDGDVYMPNDSSPSTLSCGRPTPEV